MTTSNLQDGALAGVKVIDLSRVLAGPYATQLLGDHGAEVIKVEPPTGDGTRLWGECYDEQEIGSRGVSTYYAGLNRNKHHVSINLATDAGRRLVLDLLADADVLVENFKPGTMERWGFGADALKERFPRLIYARISAFGADGPMGGLGGYDAILQAYTGIMYMNGERDRGPLRVPMPITDITTGMLTFAGILLALYERERSGIGQVVDLTLLDTALSLLHPAAANYFLTGASPTRVGTAHPNISPSEIFKTADGHEVYVAAGTQQQFVLLCDYLGAPELASDPRFESNDARLRHNDELTSELRDRVSQLSLTEDSARDMIARGIPASVVRPINEALRDPQVTGRGMVHRVGGIETLGVPIRLSRTPGSVRTPPTELGSHTRDVLERNGLSPELIEELLAQGVVVASTARRPEPNQPE